MGSLGNINVGMQLDAVDFHRGMGGARAEVRTFGHDVDRMGSALRGVFAGIAVGTAVHGLVSMAKAAAHVEEAVHGLGVTFGDQADAMEEHVRRMSGAFKIGLGTLLDRTNAIGSFFQGAGLDDEKTAQFTKAMLQVANDYYALKDVPIDVSMEKFQSALAGEIVPLRAFGIQLSEGMVNAEAYRLRLAKAGGEVSEFAKMQARASLIVTKGAEALGVAAHEADGAAAKMAGFSGAWENFTTQVGETFAPAVGEALGTASDLLTVTAGLWKDNEAASTSWLTGLSAELGLATTGLGAMTEAAGLLADAGWMINHAFTAAQSGILGALGEAAGFLGDLMPDHNGKLVGGGGLDEALGPFLRAFGEEAGFRVKDMDAEFLKA
ncbi:hypothetical protein [Paludisphaera soli]|uniref:hypothetical protein n=1 Tax=Paludisphaera soli TaxID=2712865 RepID=UPI0013EE3963|nr:hypothetical protein [Paludisphaera soli]